jgi:HEPN domain-containing protein
MTKKEELVRNWIRKAQSDILAAQHEISFPDSVTESICFHCQQGAEKLLKGYLLFLNIPIRKTHEIGELITLIESVDSEFAELKEEADKLTDYAINIRYPDEPNEPSLAESHEALIIALRIREIVLRKISTPT